MRAQQEKKRDERHSEGQQQVVDVANLLVWVRTVSGWIDGVKTSTVKRLCSLHVVRLGVVDTHNEAAGLEACGTDGRGDLLNGFVLVTYDTVAW